MDQSLSVTDLLDAFKRRAWILLLTVPLVSLIGLAVAYLLPPIYTSTATVLVESQQIPDDLARSTVTADAGERLELIKQRLMSRQSVLDLIDRLDLFKDRQELSQTDKVELVRDATAIEPIRLGPNNRRGPVNVAAFTIAYQDEAGWRAARVANEFVTMVLEQNVKARSQRASETNNFFKKEVEQLLERLIQLETQITQFKGENEKALPDSIGFRRNELAELQTEIFENQRQQIGLRENRRSLVQSLTTGQLPSDALSPAERDLEQLKRGLDQRLAIYSENHPEIKLLKSRIAALEKSITPGSEVADSSAENTQARRRSEADRRIATIDAQLDFLKKQMDSYDERRVDLEESVARTPQVEIGLNALMRKHDSLQAQYQEAVKKQAEAEIGEKLEVNRQAERFEVIEHAQVPPRPDKPNRVLIALGGFGGSIGFGFGLIFLFGIIDRSIYTAGDLKRQLDIRPIAVIPYVATESEMRRKRLIRWSLVLVFLVVLPSTLFAVDQFYMPLDLLLEKVMGQLGLENAVRILKMRTGL